MCPDCGKTMDDCYSGRIIWWICSEITDEAWNGDPTRLNEKQAERKRREEALNDGQV